MRGWTPDTAPACDEARQSFRETVAHYLSLSIVLGILGGLQSLSFMVGGVFLTGEEIKENSHRFSS